MWNALNAHYARMHNVDPCLEHSDIMQRQLAGKSTMHDV